MTKKDKQSISTALLCILLLVLALIVGARAGWVSAEKHIEPECVEIAPEYDPLEVIIEHEYIYTPLPVDYEVYEGIMFDDEAAVLLAKMAYGEYRGNDDRQVTMTMWCVLNRVDSPLYPDTIAKVVNQPSQFMGYSPYNPVDARLYELAVQTLKLWEAEKLEGERTLPKEYLYFSGNGEVNIYRTQSGDIYGVEK